MAACPNGDRGLNRRNGIRVRWTVRSELRSTSFVSSAGRTESGVSRILLIVGAAWIGNWLFKQAFARSRPLGAAGESVSRYGFPSGHSANSLALLGGLAAVTHRARARRYVLAFGVPIVLLIGFSRLAIAVHYPSDVVAAWLWVLGWIVLVWPRPSLRAPASWRETRRA